MILMLGQRWLTCSVHILAVRCGFGKGFVCWFGINPLMVPKWSRGISSGRRSRLRFVEDRDGVHPDRRFREVLAVARRGGDRVHDVEAPGDHAEDRVALRQRVVGVHDEELRAVGVRPGVRHRERAAGVAAGERLVGELVAGAAGADPALVQRGLLAVLAVAALDHEAGDDAVEDDVVVEALPGELDEVGGGLGRALGEQVGLDAAGLGGDDDTGHGRSPWWFGAGYGVATVTLVMTT